MRIAFLNYHYQVAGSATGAAAQVRSIAEGLRGHGHEVDLHFRAARKLVEAATSESASVTNLLKKSSLARRYLNMPKNFLRNIPFVRQEKRLFRETKPDLVMAVASYGNYSAGRAARSLGLPFVAFCEDPGDYEYATFFPQYAPWSNIGSRIDRYNLRRADAVICISEILKGFLVGRGLDPQHLHVIPNGVDHHRFRPQPRDGELNQSQNLAGRTVIGFIGSFNYFDDIPAIADSFAAVARDQADVVYLFVGPHGGTSSALHQALADRGLADRCRFPGAVPHEEAHRWLSLMDIVIAPYLGNYLFYGSSLKVLEYMACGKATVATALGQIREQILDGHNGMLFEWRDYAAFARALAALAADRDLRDRIGRAARATIERGWTWERQTGRIAAVLADVLSRRAGNSRIATRGF
jgi:glycosyltransferase involved in cell wall biosynthesis